MSYLLDFIKSFTTVESEKFRKLDLTGKEELVRNEYADNGRQKDFDESTLHVKLNLSKTHLDKINSVLLDKTLSLFTGEGWSEKLEFLLAKQLNGLILHEIKLGEKRLKGNNDTEGLRELYKQAFTVLQRFNYNDYPVQQLEDYCNLYTHFLTREEEGEQCRAHAKKAEVLIRYYYLRKEGTDKRDRLLEELLELSTGIEGKRMLEAEVAVNLGISAYYETSDPEKGLHYLQLADVAAQKIYDKIRERDKAFLLAMAAQLLIDLGRYEEGLIKYHQLFSEFPALASARVYHPFQYVFALLIVNDFAGAAVVLKKYLEPILNNDNARNFHFDILRLYAIYHLLNKETALAGNYIQQLMTFSKEDFTVLGDILLRLVHNVYCAQTGDYVLAADMLKKNMKYIDSKMNVDGFADYKKMFLDLGKVIRFKSKAGSGKTPFAENEIAAGDGRARLYQNLIKLPLQS